MTGGLERRQEGRQRRPSRDRSGQETEGEQEVADELSALRLGASLVVEPDGGPLGSRHEAAQAVQRVEHVLRVRDGRAVDGLREAALEARLVGRVGQELAGFEQSALQMELARDDGALAGRRVDRRLAIVRVRLSGLHLDQVEELLPGLGEESAGSVKTSRVDALGEQMAHLVPGHVWHDLHDEECPYGAC